MTRSRVGSMKLRRRVEIRNSRPKTWKRNASERVVVASCLGRLERTREERMVTRFSRVILCWRSPQQQRWIQALAAELHMPARPLAKVLSDKLRCYVASYCMAVDPKFMEEHFPQHHGFKATTQRAYAYLIFFSKVENLWLYPIDKVLDTKTKFYSSFLEALNDDDDDKMWNDKLRLGRFCIYSHITRRS